MSAVLTSRVTQLLYKTAPHLNFAQVVVDLHGALVDGDLNSPTLTWDCDDIALIDFDAKRVIVAFNDNLPAPYAACLTIAAGQLPRADVAILSPEGCMKLCKAFAEQLVQRFPSDAQQSQSIAQALTSDLIDCVTDELFANHSAKSDDRIDCGVTGLSAQMPASRQGDVETLMNMVSSELVSRAPSLITLAIASATQNTRAGGGNTGRPAAPRGITAGCAPSKPSYPRHLFWSKGLRQPNQPAGAIISDPSKGINRGTSGELQSLRAALYAVEQSNAATAPKRLAEKIASQTMRTIHSFASLPGDLAASVSDLRRSIPMADRIRH